jgi:hypothetical protein
MESLIILNYEQFEITIADQGIPDENPFYE